MSNADVLAVCTAFLLSACATGLMRLYALRTKLLDVPNHRSSHSLATPRGGGLGFVIVFLISVLASFLYGDLETPIFLSLFVFGSLIAGVGFVDDKGDVRASRRLMVQVAAAASAIMLLGGLPDVPFGNTRVDLGIVGDVIAVVFIVWLINLYNFMDGIDGIAAVQTISVVSFAFILLHGQTGSEFSLLLVLFGAAVAGFLVWNWPPAKIFMGDVGSGFLGFVLAIFAIVSSGLELLSIWVWIILSGVFIADATFTLIARIIRGQQWYSPHNSHAYQIAARRFHGHRPVTIAVLLINTLWLLPLAWLASLIPASGWWLSAIALAPLVFVAYRLEAGRDGSQTSG